MPTPDDSSAAVPDAAPGAAELAAALGDLRRDLARLEAEIARVIVGQTEIVDGVVGALLAGGHALLEGVPGLGKTLLVCTLAEALDLPFARIQFTPDLMPADILGTQLLVEDREGGRRFEFQRGPIFASVVLADEVNRATPKTQSALLEAMQEQAVTISKQRLALSRPFFVLATQNPLEMEGTYPLPEAQLDRFLVKLKVRFPSREALHAIMDRTTQGEPAHAAKVLDAARVVAMQQLVRRAPVARSVQDFALRVLEGTHPDAATAQATGVRRYVRYGASPRGAQALLLLARIRALRDGRFAASTDDVRAVAKPALRHRLLLNFEGEAEGKDPDALLDAVLAATPELV